MATNYKTYSKAPLTTAQVLTKLQGQGLDITPADKATEFLNKVSYFRFRGYLYPYLDLINIPAAPSPKNFKPNSKFSKAREVYLFDEGLRCLIFKILPELEVALRCILDSTLSEIAGHGFWHTQEEWFKRNKFPKRILNSLSNSFCDSSEKYASHYRENYYNDNSHFYKQLPPFWVLCELSTIGQIMEIYETLNEAHTSIDTSPGIPNSTLLDKMARNKFGASQYRELVNWVRVLRAVRNISAHHGRLWNKNILAPSGITSKVTIHFPFIPGTTNPKTNSVYASLVIIRIMCKKIGIDDGIKKELKRLFRKYPESNKRENKFSMGIPVRWESDDIWK